MSAKRAYLDPALDVSARVRDLLGRMTLKEKVRQMGCAMSRRFYKRGRVSRKMLRDTFGDAGIGTLQDPRFDPEVSAEVVNDIQQYMLEETRLGVPVLFHSECLHGHLSRGATVFPQAIGLASTWNTELVGRMAKAAAREARAVGVSQTLSPDLDLARDPRWGRVEETYGEDPYLVGRMGVAYIRAVQGEGPALGPENMICTAKHFAAHGSPEGGVNIGPVAGGMRDLRNLYLPPFKAAVTEARVGSVMPAYSEYDGVPAHASKLLLQRILREEWGFQGYVFSDYGGIYMLHKTHRTAANAAEAGRQALEAGLDLEAPGDWGFGQTLMDLVEKGELDVALVDRAVARILRAKFLAGLFENPYADTKTARRVVHCAEHRALAREVAQEAIILLKNVGNLLPLDPKKLRKIAVIGPNADRLQYGDYAWPRPDGVTALQGIRKAVGKGVQVAYAEGCPLWQRSRDGMAEAINLAKESDVAIVVIGGSSIVTSASQFGVKDQDWTCGESRDRAELTPPGLQEDLARAVYGTGTPTIVVMIHGRPYGIPWIAEHVPAILEAWYPGEEGGNALADVIFGKVNPSGRLPVSVPQSVGHVPVFYNRLPSARGYYRKPGTPDQPGCDYVFSSTAPLFPFGHGLSYTTFKYSRLRLAPKRIPAGGRVTVSVDVTNTGPRAGKEVVQLYLTDLFSAVTTPVRALKRFEKVLLEPGQTRTLVFVLMPDDLAIINPNGEGVVESGEFEVELGGLKGKFAVM